MFFIFIASCTNDPYAEALKNPVNVKIYRFEQDLFNTDISHIKDSISFFEKKYGDFFEIFTYKIINIGGPNNPMFAEYIKGFVTDFTINEVYQQSQKDFADLNDIERSLSKGFSMFQYYFPNKPIPKFYSFISGFNQSIVSSDSLVAIGLDKYFGPQCPFYEHMNSPLYMRYLMNKERITTDCLKSWIMANYEMDAENNLLNNMLYHGKISWCLKKTQPDIHDSIIFGIDPQKLKWCKQNEEKMWIYLVEYKKLYSTDLMTIGKFINEGPFTKDFTNNSPAKAAIWIGYKIVNEYMQRENTITPDTLMKINDYQEMLRRSKYNP